MKQVYLDKTHFVSSKSLQQVLEQAPGQAAKPSSFAISLDDSSEIQFQLHEAPGYAVPGQEFEYKIFSSDQSLFVLSINGRIGYKGWA